MRGHTVILHGPSARRRAKELIDAAPLGSVMNVRPEKRTLDQNAKFWAMLSDISQQKPLGRSHPPEIWKCLLMNACGYAVQFEQGLSGEPFPIGFRSSRLSKAQMSELIEFMYAWGAEQGIVWSDEMESA